MSVVGGVPGGGGAVLAVGGVPLVAVIVVAGGRSTRFGSDKLQHRIHGRTLLERTTAAAAAVAPVVLVTAGDVPGGVGVAVSESPQWGGPCAAVAAGVDAVAGAGDVLVVPADLADPEAALGALTLIPAGVLTDADGHPQWLLARSPLAGLRRRVAELRSSGGEVAGLPASALFQELPGRHAVPAEVCADIDTRADLPAAADADVDTWAAGCADVPTGADLAAAMPRAVAAAADTQADVAADVTLSVCADIATEADRPAGVPPVVGADAPTWADLVAAVPPVVADLDTRAGVPTASPLAPLTVAQREELAHGPV
jgi:molybdopterin-guanine dinucleotide biosynthesis protein A